MELGSSSDDGPRPDVISYNTVLAAWSKIAGVRPGESPSAGEGGAQKRKGVVGEFAAHEALRLLDEIEGRYLQSFENAAQHCEDGTPTARKAEEILSRMIESGIEPDAYSYNGVLLARVGRTKGPSQSSYPTIDESRSTRMQHLATGVILCNIA